MGGAGTWAGVLGVRGTLGDFSAMRAVLIGRPERRIGSARIVWCAAGPSPGMSTVDIRQARQVSSVCHLMHYILLVSRLAFPMEIHMIGLSKTISAFLSLQYCWKG